MNKLTEVLNRLGWLNMVLFIVFAAAVPILTFVFNHPALHPIANRLGAFGLAVVVSSLFWRAFNFSRHSVEKFGWGNHLATALLFSSSIYLILSYIPEITNYPFTLTWSEASRYYYASLYLSERVYGIKASPTVLHPSRYLLQAIPFVLTGTPIWLHRAWQVMLWIVTPITASLVLALRLKIPPGLRRWRFIAAAYLVFMVGPVYYHLLIPVIIMLWGFHTLPSQTPKKKQVLTFLAVVIASAWAGISRINWYPVPGLMAAALIILEEPIRDSSWRTTRSYLFKLSAWVFLGTVTAFAAQAGYILWSGNSTEQFTTSFSSSLLWHRLLPNATYPPGILVAILFVSLPMLVLIYTRVFNNLDRRKALRRFNPIRLLGLACILLVFFAGGMIVSLKIGGGSNLHNLDAYLTFLLLISSYFFYERVAEEPIEAAREADQESIIAEVKRANTNQGLTRVALIFGLVLYTVSAVITHVPAPKTPSVLEAQDNLSEIATPVYRAIQNGGEVLFISNRQLLTFNYLEVPLIPEYERVFLMEAAMANDVDYLESFYQDLADQRYSLIISEPLSRELKGPKEDFGAESNAWANNVAAYVLCYYTPIKTLRTIQTQILAPAQKPKKNCP